MFAVGAALTAMLVLAVPWVSGLVESHRPVLSVHSDTGGGPAFGEVRSVVPGLPLLAVSSPAVAGEETESHADQLSVTRLVPGLVPLPTPGTPAATSPAPAPAESSPPDALTGPGDAVGQVAAVEETPAAQPPSARDLAFFWSVMSLEGPLQRTALGALDEVRYEWWTRLPGWQITFLPARHGVRGLTFPGQRRIEIYVRGSDTPSSLAWVVGHELGHAVDVTHLSDSERSQWSIARLMPTGTRWYPAEAAATDSGTAAGDFAEVFAFAVGPSARWPGPVRTVPTASHLSLLMRVAA